jgi:hypothetical protein
MCDADLKERARLTTIFARASPSKPAKRHGQFIKKLSRKMGTRASASCRAAGSVPTMGIIPVAVRNSGSSRRGEPLSDRERVAFRFALGAGGARSKP